jgi:hypothetical protein
MNIPTLKKERERKGNKSEVIVIIVTIMNPLT